MGKASRKKKTDPEVSVLQHGKRSSAATMDATLLHNRLVHLSLIIVIGFIAYSNTFHASFHFDDYSFIANNPAIKDLSFFIDPSKAKELTGHLRYNLKNRYVGFLTLALNYKTNGLDVVGYHAFNLAVHLTNALLVYLFTVMSLSKPFLKRSSPESLPGLVALFVGLFFVCHPLQTQAVTYIWQRVTSLATLFYLLSIVCYIKSRLAKLHVISYSLLALSIISAVLAMKTKEISFTLPVIITLYEFMFFEGKMEKRIRFLIPIILTMVIIPLTLLGAGKPVGDVIGDISEATRVQTTMSRWDYLFTQFRVIVTYIRLLFLPVSQNLDYDYPSYHSFSSPNVFLSFLLLLSIFALGVYLFYRSHTAVHNSPAQYPLSRVSYNLPAVRLIAFGIFWFFITLSVESSVIPIADVILEHRVYLPSVGAFIVIMTCIFMAIANKWHELGKAIIAMLSIIIVILTGVTFARNTVWLSDISLWRDVTKKSPGETRSHNNLGMAYLEQDRLDEAINEFIIALKLRPDLALAHYNLGTAYAKQNRLDEAINEFMIALKLKPDYGKARHQLEICYERMKMMKR